MGGIWCFIFWHHINWEMKNIQILDCTLRDGGRVINCEFSDKSTNNILRALSDSNIDIIEVGFLRDKKNVQYNGNSTFFTNVKQMSPFISQRKRESTKYVTFVDYGMYDFSDLDPRSKETVDGIRVGFTKKDYKLHKEELCNCFRIVKEKGYELFIQGVNSLAYSDYELLELIQCINDVKPYSFGIVDTYGAMYIEDAQRIFGLVEYNLNPYICIDIHLHNNFQLAFAIAQQLTQMIKSDRKIIVDATLNGMGKCAGNLNTELIAEYLNCRESGNYEMDAILDVIDDYIVPIKRRAEWGYTVPAFIAGIYRAHPNNIIYMTGKKMEMKDIRHVLANIDVEVRQRYDYENIEKTYVEYIANKIDDMTAIEKLQKIIEGQEVLVIAPGKNVIRFRTEIDDYIMKNDPIVISVNFVYKKQGAYCFVGYKKRYESIRNDLDRFIIPSNIKKEATGENEYIINYESVIDIGYKLYDNSTMMLLNLLKKVGVKKIAIAGFDGFHKSYDNNFVDDSFDNDRHMDNYDAINEEIAIMVKEFCKKVKRQIEVQFLTPSIYCNESILVNHRTDMDI